jgi:hypothetical protein
MMEGQEHNSSVGQGQYGLAGPNLNSTPKLGLNNAGKVPVKGGRRRSRYRFQEVQTLVSMEPAGSVVAPSPIPVFKLDLIQSKPSVVLATQLKARQLMQADLLKHNNLASIDFEGVRAAVLSPLAQQSADILANSIGVMQPAVQQGPLNKAGLQADSAATLWPLAGDVSSFGPTVEVDEKVSEKPELEDDPFYDSTIALRESGRTRSLRTWQRTKQLFLGRRFSQAMVAIMVVVFVSTLDVPWRNWFSDQIVEASSRLEVAINSVTQPIRERAAFFIVDEFEQGADAWVSEGSMTFDPGGLLRVNGMALHKDTMHLASYRMDFDAKIEKSAVGWVVRAQDMQNYYAFKLVETVGRSATLYELQRYAVIEGVETAAAAVATIPVPGHLPNAEDFNRFSIRVRESQMTTLVNGWGVDYWRDSRLKKGGVGFLGEGDESSLISRVTVSGNDDTWGLILYGTVETIRSVRETVSPHVAMITLSPIPLEMLRRQR